MIPTGKNLVLAEGGRKHTTTTFQSAASVHIPWVGSRSSDSGKWRFRWVKLLVVTTSSTRKGDNPTYTMYIPSMVLAPFRSWLPPHWNNLGVIGNARNCREMLGKHAEHAIVLWWVNMRNYLLLQNFADRKPPSKKLSSSIRGTLATIKPYIIFSRNFNIWSFVRT